MNSTAHQKFIHDDQMVFNPGMQALFTICKSINMHSIDADKAFDKSHHPFRIKTLKKLDFEGTYFKILKAIYEKHLISY
jgi:hypothetical protein